MFWSFYYIRELRISSHSATIICMHNNGRERKDLLISRRENKGSNKIQGYACYEWYNIYIKMNFCVIFFFHRLYKILSYYML